MRCLLILLVFCPLIGCKTISIKPKKKSNATEINKTYIQKFHEGLRLKMTEQIDGAIKSFESASAFAPEEDAPHFALAQCYLIKNDLGNASTQTKIAADLDPNNTWYLQELAYMYKELNDSENGAKIYKKLLKIQPHKAEWLFEYAALLEATGKLQEAIAMLNETEKEIGVNSALSIRKYYLYLKLKNEKLALKELEIAKQKNPKDVRIISTEIDYYFDTKQDEKAFKIMEELVEADPTNGNARKLLGDYYLKTNQLEKSIEQYQLAIKCDLSIDDRMMMAIKLFDLQAPNSVMDELSSYILEIFPENIKAYTFRGDYLQRTNQPKKALEVYLKGIEYDKSKYLIWQEILLIEYELQDFTQLNSDAKRCLEFFPAIPNVYLLAGLSANQLKKYDEALEHLTSGIDFVMQDDQLLAEFHGQFGEAYFGKKEIQKAQESYKKALKLSPTSSIIKNNFAFRLALHKVDLSYANQLIDEVISLERNTRYFDTKGFILFQSGKFQEALVVYQKITNEDSDKVVLEHLGDAYFKTGDKTNALIYWKKSLAAGSTNKVLKQKIDKTEYYEPEY
ncbi:MAG: tetratricopeptide repeat protein [Bacteroidota bacterium]